MTAKSARRVHRIEVRPRPGVEDVRARALIRQGAGAGIPVRAAATARIYLIEGDLSDADRRQIEERLLADPVTEEVRNGDRPAVAIEVHPLPGVMDPVAQSVRQAIRDLVGEEVSVSTGLRYELDGLAEADAQRLGRRVLANPVIHAIHTRAFHPDSLPAGHETKFAIRHIAIRALDDAALERLSRDAHLFLSLEEMRAIRDHYKGLDREPTDIELETLAQTWSEHCVHKTLKSRIRYRHSAPSTPRHLDTSTPLLDFRGRPGHTVNADGSVTIDNLLKSTVAAATHDLIKDGVDWTLSVFKDNSGVIAFDDQTAVCIKVETHNHPSAIEPYGGAATGAGGCIRDVIGTGLGAKPIANTDIFCVARPDSFTDETLPPGCLHPRRILTDIVAGVRDYGNRMGIPTLNGAVVFDDRYVGNPLVFCGCIGVMPRDRVHGKARPGDRVIAVGGRTGRDGIHGATFSSAELEQTASDEFAHAVQIGNAIEEKRVLDAILRARDDHDEPLYTAITDCGAGGFSSAVGEMGGELGAEIHLDRAPLKYAGLTYTEIWISEAQERMVLAVPPANVETLRRICAEEGVEMADLGHFGVARRSAAGPSSSETQLVLHYRGTEVGRLDTRFLHDGLPQPTREAVWESPQTRRPSDTSSSLRASVPSCLRVLLAHPNIASKHWIIRQYDHEVQGNTILKPLVGPGARGPGDAAVIEPVPGSGRALAIACGLQTGIGDPAVDGDPYLMALAAIDECVRNLVCVGADPTRIAILDNFCWPSCAKPENLGTLVRAAEGCYDGAKAYRTPFVSGKDSLNNQLRYTDPATGKERLIEIPPTLLISGISIVPDIRRVTTMDAKSAANILILIGRTTADLGGSHIQAISNGALDGSAVPATDLDLGPRAARAVFTLISRGLVASAHDVSDGGLLTAIAEMLIAAEGSLGASLDLAAVHADPIAAAFSESPSRYILEIAPGSLDEAVRLLRDIPWTRLGALDSTGRLCWKAADLDAPVSDLSAAWRAPLDW